jgi:hypothetical protein
MLGPRSNSVSPAKPQAAGQLFPLSVLLAFDPCETPGNDAMEQGPPAPQTLLAAIFPQDESQPVPAFFAADTAFDCEDGEGAMDWPSCAD